MTITDEEIQKMIVDSMEGRQNSYKRGLRQDASAALAGSVVCRELMVHYLERSRSVTVTLPSSLVEAIDRYLDTDWSDGRDPSKFGALNAACYIGERVAAIRKASRPK